MSDVTPGVLSDDDLRTIRSRFGVDDDQVRRDHVISHALAALASLDTDSIVFFGGTALSRTHLTDLRLSEDIDLVVLGPRTATARALQDVLTRNLRRAFRTPEFEPALASTRGASPSVMTVGSIRIQIQLARGDRYPLLPTELRELEQRYADAPPARMRVLTAAAFAAAKLSAWHDRAAARDLYDMWAMAERGLIDREARELFSRLGPLTDAARVSYSRVPGETEWSAALGHQGIVQVGPDAAADIVRTAWEHA